MTPRDVDQLSPNEFQVMTEYAIRQQRAEARRARKGSRGR